MSAKPTNQPSFLPSFIHTNKQRLYFIDLLESIAIFLVLSYHCTNYSFNFLEGDSSICFFVRYYIRTILTVVFLYSFL